MKINKYILERNDDNYIVGFNTVISGNYDFEGQMADYPEACEGWCKLENNQIVVDEEKKAEIIEERRRKEEEPTDLERLEAQVFYTAMETDTLLEE